MIRRTFLLFASFLLFTSLAIAGKTVERRNSEISVNVDLNTGNQEVLSEVTEGYESTNTPTTTAVPTAAITIVNEVGVEEVDPTATIANSKIDSYIYPGALISAKTDTEVSATSSDDTKKVTDWYENKIKSDGFNVKSFVRTNTNNVVKNVISAAKANEEIKVEITNSDNGSSIKLNFYPN